MSATRLWRRQQRANARREHKRNTVIHCLGLGLATHYVRAGELAALRGALEAADLFPTEEVYSYELLRLVAILQHEPGCF